MSESPGMPRANEPTPAEDGKGGSGVGTNGAMARTTSSPAALISPELARSERAVAPADIIAVPEHAPFSKAWLVRVVLSPFAVVLPFLFAAWPLIIRQFNPGRGAFDSINFHEPVIRTFAADWPAVDLSNYLSATTPGYHLLLAFVARFLSDDSVALQLVGSLVTVLLLWTLCASLSLRSGPLRGILYSLPVAFSMYVFFSGVWMLPDNAGWLGVLAVMLFSLRRKVDAWTYVGAGLALALVVFVRQIHLWVAAPLAVACWLGPARMAFANLPGRAKLRGMVSAQGLRELFVADFQSRVMRSIWCLLAVLPAVLVVAYFYRIWDGLTPPVFQGLYHGGNPSTTAFMLALIGLYSPFFAGTLLPSFMDLVRNNRLMLVLAVVIAVMVVVLCDTTFSREQGRWTGVWDLVKYAPYVGHVSPVMLGLACVGAVALVCWLMALPQREAVVFVVALTAFTTAQGASFQLWQRYNEPFLLMLMALLAARCVPMAGQTPVARLSRGLALVGPAALAVAFAAITAWVLLNDKPADFYDFKLDSRTTDFVRGVPIELIPQPRK